jgi:hypothetical protein
MRRIRPSEHEHHHRDGVAAGTAQANDTRATSAELDREGEQATKRHSELVSASIARAVSRCGEFDPASMNLPIN